MDVLATAEKIKAALLAKKYEVIIKDEGKKILIGHETFNFLMEIYLSPTGTINTSFDTSLRVRRLVYQAAQ